MAKNGFKAMDSDLHVMEPPDLWQRYIDKAYADRAPIGLTRHTRDLGMQVEGRILPKRIEVGDSSAPMAHREKIMERYKDAIARNFDSASQVDAMDREGLDLAVLFPTRGLFVLGIDGMDPGLGAAIARAYNDWLHDFCQAAPDRMFGAAMVAPHDVESAAREVRRTAGEYGFKAIFLRPNHVNGHLWGDRYYDPLWAACQEHNLAVGFHEGALVDLPQTTPHQLIKTFAMQNVLSLPLSNMFACADMIYGGVMERFPELRVAFLEGNCAWVPWLLWRMEEYMELTGPAEYPDLKLEPQEYFQRQCYASIECDEAVAKHIPEYGLEHNIVFSTDYPHRDAKFPHAVASFLELPFPDEIKRKYLWDNCLKLYDLKDR
jgi:predicted TIM-barrel fold metal-dependent hydrolase